MNHKTNKMNYSDIENQFIANNIKEFINLRLEILEFQYKSLKES